MAGIIHKIGDTLHLGGNKEEDKRKQEELKRQEDYKHAGQHNPQQKEGFVEKIKDKIHGGEGQGKDGQGKDGKFKDGKKKKKEKKKHDDGHSSSSDSD